MRMRAPIRQVRQSDRLSPLEKAALTGWYPRHHVADVTDDRVLVQVRGVEKLLVVKRAELAKGTPLMSDLFRRETRMQATSAQLIEPAGGWIKLISAGPAGRIDCRDNRGPFYMTDVNAVIEATRSLDMEGGLPIDLNHSTDLATEKGGEAPAVGWIRELQARGTDLFGRAEWSAKGKTAIARGPNGEPPAYRYISPVFSFNRITGEIMQLLRAGLTNSPNLYRSAICSRNSSENTHSLSSDELAICRHLGISRHAFAAARQSN